MKQPIIKVKRITAVLLAFILLMSVDIHANIQLPVVSAKVENVDYSEGKDLATGQQVIRPKILYQWQDPDDWAKATGPGYTQQKDDPDGYRITLQNISLNKTEHIQVPYTGLGTHELEISDYNNLETGSLYKIAVRPYHNHINPKNGQSEPAPYNATDPYAYAITDLGVKLESTDESISVIWDDLGNPDFKYQIVYALGDYSDIGATQAFYNNKEGDVTVSATDPDVIRFYDSASRRKKLKYVLKEKIYPGQIYSIKLDPLVETYEGKDVIRNRNLPLIHSVSTNVKLSYIEEGEALRLQWKIPSSFEVGKKKQKYSLTETKLVEIVDGNERNIAIFKGIAGAINYYMVNKPEGSRRYQLKLKYESVVAGSSKPEILAISNVLLYSPVELRITPTKPDVPKLITKAQIKEWLLKFTPEEVKQKLSEEGYLLNSYTYSGELSEIFSQNVVYHWKKNENNLNLVWGAFRRKDIDVDSPTYNKVIADLDTYYDISITDDYNALSSIPEVEKDLKFEKAQTDDFILNSKGDVVGFHKTFNKYYDKKTKQLSEFKPNRIYYIKLVAKKKIGEEEYKSDPTIVSFYYDALGIYAPPVLTKPPLRELKEKTTDHDVTIGWLDKWYEVVNIKPLENPPLSEWMPVAWVKGNEVYNVKTKGAEKYEIYKSEKELNRFLAAVKDNDKYKFISRQIDMGVNSYGDSTIKYQFTKIPYDAVLKEIEYGQVGNAKYGFDDYFEDLLQKDKKDIAPLDWKIIDPEKNVANPAELIYREAELDANTTYMFVLYPYREMKDGTKIYAHFPTPILVSTKPEPDIVEPDPTVPKLFVVGQSDTTIDLAWKYNKDFTYKIKYTETINGKEEVEVPVEISEEPTDPNFPNDGDFFILKVKDLFPDTSYNFYIQAVNPKSQKESDWSNAVTGRTLPILPPPAPHGFGLADVKDMIRYKYEKSVSQKYFAVQWVRLNQDKEEDNNNSDKKLNKKYDYILEIADNEGFIDPIIVNTSEDTAENIEVLEKTLVKINGLVPGKAYYARAKTRLTVSSGNKQIIVDSLNYTNVVRINTKIDENEYDGNKDPNLEILPDKNYEIIYNPKDKSLTFRFRYNKLDSDKNADNRVDQRLINELIKKGIYTYTADLSKFKNKEVKSRQVEIPYPVYEAFLNYKVKLKVLADKSEILLPMSSVEKEVTRQKKMLGAEPKVRIQLLETTGMKGDAVNLRQISPVQALAVAVESNKLKTNLPFLYDPVKIGLKPIDRTEIYQKEPIAYLLNSNKQERAVNGKYDKATNLYSFTTKDLGKYGLYSGTNALVGQPALQYSNHWSEVYRNKVASHMAFKNLGYYNPNQAINAQAFYNGLYAVTKNERELDFAGDIYGDKKRSLVNSSIMPSNVNYQGNVNRMQAFRSFVRVYEMIQDSRLNYDKNKIARVAKAQGVSNSDAIALLKAESVGLLSNIESSAPNRGLSYGEYFTLLSKLKNW